jgi:hypothetical protein
MLQVARWRTVNTGAMTCCVLLPRTRVRAPGARRKSGNRGSGGALATLMLISTSPSVTTLVKWMEGILHIEEPPISESPQQKQSNPSPPRPRQVISPRHKRFNFRYPSMINKEHCPLLTCGLLSLLPCRSSLGRLYILTFPTRP